MSSDPKNPFAASASPRSGAIPSPFQTAAPNSPSGSGGVPVASPFQTATPKATLPDPKRPAESPASPFALVDEVASSSPFEPALIEPTEGFEASEATPPPLEAAPPAAPVAIPEAPKEAEASKSESHPGGADRSDPFAAPRSASPSQGPARRDDFALPAENEQAHPAPMQAQPTHGQSAPVAAPPAITGETTQLVLRAIFGVARDLDRNEILQRARTLPGIRNLQVVGQTEAAAMSALRESIQRMGFGDKASLTLTTSGGVVDIIEEPGTSLAVLHEGTYPAGIQETLIIVARELSRLS